MAKESKRVKPVSIEKLDELRDELYLIINSKPTIEYETTKKLRVIVDRYERALPYIQDEMVLYHYDQTMNLINICLNTKSGRGVGVSLLTKVSTTFMSNLLYIEKSKLPVLPFDKVEYKINLTSEAVIFSVEEVEHIKGTINNRLNTKLFNNRTRALATTLKELIVGAGEVNLGPIHNIYPQLDIVRETKCNSVHSTEIIDNILRTLIHRVRSLRRVHERGGISKSG